jgi:predicted NAD/FAD-dependent oxidoreductase
VVGAGIAGLLAARTLHERGVRVTVIDKGRGVGGRMATRRVDDAVLDHGAQFFTVRSDRFRALVDGWLAAGLAVEWGRGFAGPDGSARADGHPRYRGADGMTTIPKALAAGLDVHIGQRVTSAAVHGAHWIVDTNQDVRLFADALILTPPVPQALALLDEGAYTLPPGDRDALAALDYAPCIALLALLWEAPDVPPPGGIRLDGEPVSWIGDSVQKGISSAPAATVHAGPSFSRAYWHADSALIAALLLEAAAPWIGTRVKSWQLHRWRYSQPTQTHDAPCLRAAGGGPPLVFAGDAFAAPQIEGAALSGLAAAEAVFSR